MPPVPQSTLEMIRKFEAERGLEVHGLLVGKPNSKPLSLLCTG